MSAFAASPSVRWGRTLFTGVLLGAASVLVLSLVLAFGSEQLGYDFRASYLVGAEGILDRGTPYPPAEDVEEQFALRRGYPYPPLTAVVLVPLALLPTDVAALVAVLGCAAALLGALALVGLRDPRCYAAVLVSAPGWNALEMANLSAVLALGIALVWRWRSGGTRAGSALGCMLAAKAVVWPLLVWSLATRRLGVGVWAVAVAVAATLLAWAAIGFAGLLDYPDVVGDIAGIQAAESYSFRGIAVALGTSETVGQVAAVVVGVSLLAGCAVLARRGDDFGSFTLAVAAGLAFAPMVWQHYLVMLFVPLAIARPRFTWLWLVPVVLWLSPRAGNGDGIEPVLPVLVAAVLVVTMLRRPQAMDGAVAT